MEVAGLPGEKIRAAGRTLELLVVPLNGLILRALEDGPMRLSDLRTRLGGPAQTTLRGLLAKLTELGAVGRRTSGATSSIVEIELTEMGRELLLVTNVLEGWLADAPNGPVPLGSEAAKGTIKALAGGWQSTMLRAFAARPLSLTQLDRLIGNLSYPALERRLSAMRSTGLVEPVPDSQGTPYAVTPWGRRCVGPISAAARFERHHMAEETPPLAPIDIEATFMLAAADVLLPANADGICHLLAETYRGERRRAGVELTVDRGRVLSCISRVESRPRNWAFGSCLGWLDALVLRSTDRLRLGGDEQLVCSVVFGLHDMLVADAGAGSPA